MTRSGVWRAIAVAALVLASPACAVANVTHGARRETSAAAPAHPEPGELAARGRALLEQGDYLRAEQYLQLARRGGHPEPELIEPLLRACIASNRLRAALGHAQRYLQAHGDAVRVRYVKSALHRALGQPAAARRELERVIADAPEHADARRLLALVLRDELGEPHAAGVEPRKAAR